VKPPRTLPKANVAKAHFHSFIHSVSQSFVHPFNQWVSQSFIHSSHSSSSHELVHFLDNSELFPQSSGSAQEYNDLWNLEQCCCCSSWFLLLEWLTDDLLQLPPAPPWQYILIVVVTWLFDLSLKLFSFVELLLLWECIWSKYPFGDIRLVLRKATYILVGFWVSRVSLELSDHDHQLNMFVSVTGSRPGCCYIHRLSCLIALVIL
jgi:hypothetical protein